MKKKIIKQHHTFKKVKEYIKTFGNDKEHIVIEYLECSKCGYKKRGKENEDK